MSEEEQETRILWKLKELHCILWIRTIRKKYKIFFGQ
jgi:hypothetical protein